MKGIMNVEARREKVWHGSDMEGTRILETCPKTLVVDVKVQQILRMDCS